MVRIPRYARATRTHARVDRHAPTSRAGHMHVLARDRVGRRTSVTNHACAAARARPQYRYTTRTYTHASAVKWVLLRVFEGAPTSLHYARCSRSRAIAIRIQLLIMHDSSHAHMRMHSRSRARARALSRLPPACTGPVACMVAFSMRSARRTEPSPSEAAGALPTAERPAAAGGTARAPPRAAAATTARASRCGAAGRAAGAGRPRRSPARR